MYCIYIHINIDIMISQNNMTQTNNIPNHQQKKKHRLTSWQRSSPRCVRVARSSSWAPPGPPLSNCSDMIFRKGGREPSSTTMISFRICLSWAADSVELGKNKPVDAAWTWICHMIFPFATSWELVVGQPYPKMDGVLFPWYIQQNVTIDRLSWKKNKNIDPWAWTLGKLEHPCLKGWMVYGYHLTIQIKIWPPDRRTWTITYIYVMYIYI